MPKPQTITKYGFTDQDKLLVDANVWLLIYGPQKPGDHRVKVYSDALKRILSAQSRVYIDVLIVSEFINTYARIKWQLISPNINFKQFRQSSQFQLVAQDIASETRRMLKHCTRINNGFESLPMNTLLNTYAAGHSDFNDQVLIALCQKAGLKLITDDADFKGQNISIITSNRKLLK